MSRSTLLVDVIEADSGVGAVAGNRIYPVRLPDDPTLPALSYTEISLVPTYGHDGDQNLDRARWQIDSWADTATDARSLAAAVRDALSGLVITSGGESYRGSFLDSSDERPEFEGTRYRVRQDWVMWHEGAVA